MYRSLGTGGPGHVTQAVVRALLCFDLEWLDCIPRQVHGRAQLDLAGMAGRVAAAIRGALDKID